MKAISVACLSLAIGGVAALYAQDGGGRGGAVQLETRVVKGMPYSAEMATESIQTLADGNRIVHRTGGRVYRDNEGRIRREEDPGTGPATVTVSDPVAGKSFTLNPATKTA